MGDHNNKCIILLMLYIFCDLRDIGFVGPKFTWIYQRADGTQIRERLDRALATSE